MARPIVTLDPATPHYASLDDAGQALCNAIAAPRGDVGNERGGVIFQAPDGSYQITDSVPGLHDSLNFSARVPQGYRLAGLVHSHPTTLSSGQVFSPQDIAIANALKVPSYVQFDNSGQCRKYVPGKTVTLDEPRVGGSGWEKTASGDPLTRSDDLQPVQVLAKALLQSTK
jgi:hypothetical protein